MDHFPHTPPNLTKNQALVMSALSDADGPLSAYTILDQLRDEGLRAPLQVYRALDSLVEFGMVHRLESLNAFVPCRHTDSETTDMVAFTICESCGKVSEITDGSLDTRIKNLAVKADFKLQKSTVELLGICHDCR
jgi:Fur family transcriptional regulator, zinc uptake regulator